MRKPLQQGKPLTMTVKLTHQQHENLIRESYKQGHKNVSKLIRHIAESFN